MKKQIERISIYQTAKLFALIMFVFTAVFAIPAGIGLLFYKMFEEAVLALLYPFFMGLMVFIMHSIIFFVYNLAAKAFGGIEITLKDVE